jgi:hypothetical protein
LALKSVERDEAILIQQFLSLPSTLANPPQISQKKSIATNSV